MADDLKILSADVITKDYVLNELNNNNLTQKEVDDLLDIISSINEGYHVYNVKTSKGDYFLFIEEDDD